MRPPGKSPGAGRRRSPWSRLRLLGAGLLVLGLAGVYSAVAAIRPLPAPDGWPPASDLAEYTAVLHVHSRYSHDGRGTVEEIASAAARAGVDVVFLTDHNTLAAIEDGKEGWHGTTLVLVGVEITTGSGYLLLLNPPRDVPVRARGYAVDDLVERYRTGGGIVLLAHPEHPRLGWRDAMPAVDGIELIDVFDQVVGAPVHRQVLGLLAYPVNPVPAILSVLHWPERALETWDGMLRERPAIAALGLDAHGGIALTEETGVRFPSHETAFRLGRLHFVTREPLRRDPEDRGRVHAALGAGGFYNAFDGLAPATGFRFEIRGAGTRALMGDTVRLTGGLVAEIRVPPVGEAVVRVRRDGAVIHEGPAGGVVQLPVTGPGVYRVEVDLRLSLFPIAPTKRMPWIFSNPIYVRG